MVASDTIVGIVGSVVLVAVMVGVFVYEYNNTQPGGDEGGRAAFEAMHAAMDADGDVDGDGTSNWEDDDLDGDGTPNADDEDVVVVETDSGTLGPRTEPVQSPSGGIEGVLGEGAQGVRVEVTLTPSAPPNAPTLSDFTVRFLLSDGTEVDQCAAANDVCSFESSSVIAGAYELVVQPVQGGLGGEWDARVEIIYG